MPDNFKTTIVAKITDHKDTYEQISRQEFDGTCNLLDIVHCTLEAAQIANANAMTAELVSITFS